MKRRKRNIKKIYKKSVFPSILLFLVFIGVCEGMFSAFIIIFESFLIDSKTTELYQKAEHFGEMLTSHMAEEDFEHALRYMEGYLSTDNNICVTDDQNHVIMKLKESTPDFENPEYIGIMEEYTVYPDNNPGHSPEDSSLKIFSGELLSRTANAVRNETLESDSWQEREIFSSHFWVEIPTKIEGHHLYFRDNILLQVKDTYYMIGAIVVMLSLLIIPTILLFINVLSSVLTQRRMVNLLYLDTATDGRNRLYFIQQSQKILRRFRNAGKKYALISLHLNSYGDYCACYGGKNGEELLKNINAFLHVNMRKQETFAHITAGDFALLLYCTSTEEGEKRLKKLMAELTGIRHEQALSYSAGIYLMESAKTNADRKQRKHADISQLYHYANAARESLSLRDNKYIKFFDEKILQDQLWKHKVENTMQDALMNHEFQLYLQPKYNPISQKLVSAEALVRWISPTDGMISPGRFIPIFEENGFITQLDDYMVSNVAKLQAERKIQGKKPIPISVNISRANFAKENLASHICQLVDTYGADHAFIELEVTESAFLGDTYIIQKILKELKTLGFRVSMDDFGAGYSSLNSLKDLPIDVLKLDMEFFRGEDIQKRGEIVVEETIRLAKRLNMEIVAEGIEKKEQVEFLAEQGCDMIQGFYFARPMPLHEFEERAKQDG